MNVLLEHYSKNTNKHDAMGSQTKIAKNIVDKGGDYLLAVKENQPRLSNKLNEIFNVKTLNTATEKVFSQRNKGHKREETIHHLVIPI
ncbi:MAG: hypothetical protein KAH18_04950 [Psychromonas sp.]|nr:hypothetical protein [Psychromonas sp.]